MGATSTKGEEGGWPHTHDTAMYHNIVLEVLSLQTTEKIKEKENAEIFFPITRTKSTMHHHHQVTRTIDVTQSH